MEPNEELYREIILDHNKNPRNYGPLPDATHEASGINENCGDQLTVHALVVNNHAEKIMFEGEGCALCKASASIMTAKLKGHTLQEIKEESQFIQKILLDKNDPDLNELDRIGDAAALLGVRNYPQRIKCVLLAWEVLRKAIDFLEYRKK